MRGFFEREDVMTSLPGLSLLSPLGMTPACIEVECRQAPDLRNLDRFPDRDLASSSRFTARVESRLGDEFASPNIHYVNLRVSAIKHDRMAQQLCAGKAATRYPLWAARAGEDQSIKIVAEFMLLRAPQTDA